MRSLASESIIKMLQQQSQKQEPELHHEKPTSEKGASTNLSQTSNETFDEELSHKKGEKFEFINEDIKEWPQWSVNEKKKQEVEN